MKMGKYSLSMSTASSPYREQPPSAPNKPNKVNVGQCIIHVRTIFHECYSFVYTGSFYKGRNLENVVHQASDRAQALVSAWFSPTEGHNVTKFWIDKWIYVPLHQIMNVKIEEETDYFVFDDATHYSEYLRVP
jgi:hypothetical protein